ncbi:hypothetical protein HXZ62_09160 [Empedobacter falsenii]|uniref:hypothetical protein n=1 Tax=Empedobacter falsenii TaxID=343874 RepID=UPI002577C312|nr:hypothetical protein [Empedobacter falsenii]MDM1062725.1 hypothetical protein [Empedobacter falsenii]
MKNKITYIIFTAFIALSSCKSTKVTTEEKANDSTEKVERTQQPTLIGRWKLVKLSGGIMGREQSPPANRVTVIEFTPTEMITIINGKETNRATYSIAQGKSIRKTEPVLMIYTNGSTSMGKSFYLEQNKLGISDEFHDGFHYTYIKIGMDDDGILRE